jgi:5-methylcytosine-specific restriction endonuclease McrA
MERERADNDKTRLQQRKRLPRRAQMKRSTLLTCPRPMKKKTVTLSSAERAVYHTATERARTAEGYLQCEGCGRSLLDGQEQRHHIQFRSQGGATDAANLLVLCLPCHTAAHGVRTVTVHEIHPEGPEDK